jgi:hypothetical protein
MAFIGEAKQWNFADRLIPKIIEMTLEAWNVVNSEINIDTKEDAITRNLIVKMRSVKPRSTHPFNIQSQAELLNNNAAIAGRIDIRIDHLQMTNEQLASGRDIYFAFECKRLSVSFSTGWQSLAQDYVQEGMMRYITEQYAKDLDKSGMLGYVMDGNVEKAMTCVKDAIGKKKQQLCLRHSKPFCSSSIQPQCNEIKETRHNVRNSEFVIHHIFLPVSQNK